MKEILKKINIYYVLTALLYLILGLVCVIIPGKLTVAIPYIIGSVLILNGLLRLIGYFTNKHGFGFGFTVYALAEGILDILLGIVLFINTSISIVMVAVIIGIWALISGILNINYAINKTKSKQECILNFIFAVTQIVIGIILFFNFKGGISVSIVVAGIYLIFLSVSIILTKILLFNKFNEIKNTVDRAFDPTKIITNNKKEQTLKEPENTPTEPQTQNKNTSNTEQIEKPKTASTQKKQSTKSSQTKTQPKSNSSNKASTKKTSTKSSTSNKSTTKKVASK